MVVVIAVYKEDVKVDNRIECGFDEPVPDGKVCNVAPNSWDPCTSEKKYNFPAASPCIFLKLNKVSVRHGQWRWWWSIL